MSGSVASDRKLKTQFSRSLGAHDTNAVWQRVILWLKDVSSTDFAEMRQGVSVWEEVEDGGGCVCARGEKLSMEVQSEESTLSVEDPFSPPTCYITAY